MILPLLFVFAGGYLLGNLNFSILITRLVGGYDIRTRGSGNAGGTNVARNLGVWWGVLVIVCEILKTAGLGMAVKYYLPQAQSLGLSGMTACGLIAVLGSLAGNMFPVFYGFKGGKGVTVIAAASLIVDWRLTAVFFSVFFVLLALTRYVSVSSMFAAVAVCVGSVILTAGQPYGWACLIEIVLCTAVVIFNHRSNIKRLIRGTENRFTIKK